MYSFTRHINSVLAGLAMMAVTAPVLTSCDAFDEKLDPCPEGLELRFVYDYNMEFANAFPSQVHCLTLYVYDQSGKYLLSRKEVDPKCLSDENWRMTLDLPAGTYKLVAYGGMECADASFTFDPAPGASVPMSDVEVCLKPGCVTEPVGTNLHPLFFGDLEVTVPENSTDYTEATVRMMKDTNNIRIILQHVDGRPVNNADFTYTVTIDNTLFDYKNNVIPTSSTVFYPWASGEEIAGVQGSEGEPVQVAYAEFSLSRFIAGAGARLEICRSSDGSRVLSIPLIDYLLLLKSQNYAEMKSQEFLDRESRWDMIFFLDGSNNSWNTTQIVINGWIVRINNITE